MIFQKKLRWWFGAYQSGYFFNKVLWKLSARWEIDWSKLLSFDPICNYLTDF